MIASATDASAGTATTRRPLAARNIVGGLPQRILGPRHHGDVAALARQFLGDGASDAEACAGDERPPAFDQEIHVNSP